MKKPMPDKVGINSRLLSPHYDGNCRLLDALCNLYFARIEVLTFGLISEVFKWHLVIKLKMRLDLIMDISHSVLHYIFDTKVHIVIEQNRF